jgi:DNA-binding NtrC family response regulator
MNHRNTVLFVDDEPHVLQGLTMSLRREPFNILTAPSAEKALEILASESVSVVVSDERMPGMSGSQLMEILRQKHPDTIRILLTGQVSLESALRAINQGEVFRLILKPANPVDLGQTVQQAIQLHEMKVAAAQLLRVARERGDRLDAIEQEHGIAEVRRSDAGAIEVSDDEVTDFESLIKAMQNEANRGSASDKGSSRAA